MKISKFNVVEKIGNNTFIYNTRSGSVLKLDEKYGELFQDYLNNQRLGDQQLIANLKKGGMLVEDDFDEISYILGGSNIKRFSGNVINYTIAPTMKCNFRCPYCYEKDINYSSMNRDVVDRMKLMFEQSIVNYKYMSIAWYGGEPLLAFDVIEDLSQKAIELYGKNNYQASIVTNGYLLTEEKAHALKRLRIKDMQITIDGPPDIHNQRRKLPSLQDTFFTILDNIKNTLIIYPELQVTIRVNVDKENVGRIDEIISYLNDYNICNKVSLYLAPVDNVNNTCDASLCLDNIEFAEEQIKFIERNIEKGYNFAYLPGKNLYICGAVSNSSYVIDALGDIYKCWDQVGRVEFKAGNILDDKPLNNYNYTKWISYSVSDSECLDCKYLPICMGGCPHRSIKSNCKRCTPIKENSRKMIELIYKLKTNQNNR